MPAPKQFVITTRAVDSDGQFTASIGPTQFLQLSAEATDYTPANAPTPVGESKDWLLQLIAAAKRPTPNALTRMDADVLIFVHGFNNTTQEVLRRTGLLQKTLAAEGWQGVVVAFDWPSDNSVLNYWEDRHDAAGVAGRLVGEVLPLLVQAQSVVDAKGQPVCTTNVHLLGHSTGAYVIMQAFTLAEMVGKTYRSDYRIGQVGFISADVSSDSLADGNLSATPMYSRINRLTNYSNGYDSVLAVSNAKRLGVSPRAGRVGLPATPDRRAVNIDCSNYFATLDPSQSEHSSTFCHSWQFGDAAWARDFAMTLDGRIDRNYIPTREGQAPKMALRAKDIPNRPKFEAQWESSGPGQ